MSIEAAFFGVLGRDAELKTSKAGKQYVRLNIRTGDGDSAQWVSVMAFDPDAIAVVDKLTKGAKAYIEGIIRIDEWTGQDGEKRTGLSCMSWHTRLSEIGRNRPPKRKPERSARERAAASAFAPAIQAPPSNDFYNDEIPL